MGASSFSETFIRTDATRDGAQPHLVADVWGGAQKAFDTLVARDKRAYGEEGGTIAWKERFTRIMELPDERLAGAMIQGLLQGPDDARFTEKYGPCGCIAITSYPGGYVFFGFAPE